MQLLETTKCQARTDCLNKHNFPLESTTFRDVTPCYLISSQTFWGNIRLHIQVQRVIHVNNQQYLSRCLLLVGCLLDLLFVPEDGGVPPKRENLKSSSLVDVYDLNV